MESIIQFLEQSENQSFIISFIQSAGTILIAILVPIISINCTSAKEIKKLKIENEERLKFKIAEENDDHENLIFSTLSKILFDFQILYVDLSIDCNNETCITKALETFDANLKIHQDAISKRLLKTPANVTSEIYKFFSLLGELKISLKEFQLKGEYEMAYVVVSHKAMELGSLLIIIKKLLSPAGIELDNAKLEILKYCCGIIPDEKTIENYLSKLKEINDKISDEKIAQIRDEFKTGRNKMALLMSY